MSPDNYRNDFDQAFRCYNAMETTKRRHFGYLDWLDSKKKKFNIDPSPAESDTLRDLLRDHNEAVHAFKEQSQLLKQANGPAHAALFEYISALNRALESNIPDTRH